MLLNESKHNGQQFDSAARNPPPDFDETLFGVDVNQEMLELEMASKSPFEIRAMARGIAAEFKTAQASK